MGGVCHCRSHCRLAKFRGLVYRENHSAVIGRKTRFSNEPRIHFQAMGSFRPITALYFPPYIKPRNFAKRQRERQWLTPPTKV